MGVPDRRQCGFLKQVSTTGEPLFDFNPAAHIAASGATERYSGYNIHGTKLVYDDNIPNQSGSAAVLVGNPEQGLCVWESAPIVEIWPTWSGAGSLNARVNVRQYAANGLLYPAAFVAITRSAVYGS
jgi:hypothetical protein